VRSYETETENLPCIIVGDDAREVDLQPAPNGVQVGEVEVVINVRVMWPFPGSARRPLAI
jgi:hypothetical protein